MLSQRQIAQLLICTAIGPILSTGTLAALSLAAEGSTALVRRADPRTGEPVPVEPAEVKPGKIYNHYSARHNRYVWAYATDGGGFSYALGPGSTELPKNFDVATSNRETQQLVEEAAGNWFKRSLTEGSMIYVRLGTDDQWQVVRSRSIRAHFDLDSGRRWEWHGSRRVSVLHSGGYLWQFNGKTYSPAGSPYALGSHIQGFCECSSCTR